jgi:FtsH-binding integral membrane protein
MKLTFFGKKSELLILTFLNLIIQSIITRFAMIKSTKNQKRNILFNLGLFIIQIGLIYAMLIDIPVMVKFVLFCIFSVTWGYTLASFNLNETFVHIAFYGCLSIFGIGAFIGTMLTLFNINLGPKVGLGLFYMLLSLLLFGIFNILTGDTMHKIYSILCVLLFSIYIIYDTNQIMQRDYNGDFIRSSLDYYLDLVNIFASVTTLQN